MARGQALERRGKPLQINPLRSTSQCLTLAEITSPRDEKAYQDQLTLIEADFA